MWHLWVINLFDRSLHNVLLVPSELVFVVVRTVGLVAKAILADDVGNIHVIVAGLVLQITKAGIVNVVAASEH